MNKLKYLLSDSKYGLLIALIGVVIQGFHTYFGAYQVSSIEHDIFTPVYAVLMSIFVSSGLLFFTLKSGRTNDFGEKTRYKDIANNFRWLETIINLYYISRKLIYIPIFENDQTWFDINYFDLSIGVVFAFAIPYILYLYSGQIDFSIKDKKDELFIAVNKKYGLDHYQFKLIDDENKVKESVRKIMKERAKKKE